jgi:hypothetical protein
MVDFVGIDLLDNECCGHALRNRVGALIGRERFIRFASQEGFERAQGALQIPPLRSPGFPVETRGVDWVHAVSFAGNRTRGRCQQREVGNPGTLRSG